MQIARERTSQTEEKVMERNLDWTAFGLFRERKFLLLKRGGSGRIIDERVEGCGWIMKERSWKGLYFYLK